VYDQAHPRAKKTQEKHQQEDRQTEFINRRSYNDE
jgi:hypothetical protein